MKKGILITILVLVLVVVFLALIGGFIYMQFNREPDIPQHSYLKIEMSGAIVDSDTSPMSKKLSVRDLWYHLKRAKIDSRIQGILLKISYPNTGFAKIDDIGRLLNDFKKSGKKVYAFIEGADLLGYYLASFADKVYVFKGGDIFLTGLATEAMFLKNTFSKLGVAADLFHIGEYKTASNMFTEDRMTPPHKESMEKLLDDIFTSVLEGIAANRKLNVATVRTLVDNSPIRNQEYLDAKLIDGILYEDELLKIASPREDMELVDFKLYTETRDPLPFEGSKKIAVIFASGEINNGKSGGRSIFGGDVLGADTVAAHLKMARKNPYIKAVVLRVDSPGGSASASDVIRREAELVAKVKPLIISMSDLAASGGYWLSMSGTKIFALPATITGSIGVVTGKFVLKGLYDKVGINKEMITTSKYAGMFTDYREFSPEERAKIMEMMNGIYQSFLEVVSKNRKLKVEDVDKIAKGRVWAGNSALKLKLVDQLGGLDDALNEAKKMAKISANEPIGVSVYPRKQSMLDMIMDLVGSKTEMTNPIASVEATLEMYKKFFPAMIMPYKLSIQ